MGRISFGGLPDVAAAQVAEDVSQVLTRLQQVGTERVSQLALSAVRRAVADAAFASWLDPERVGLYLGTGMGARPPWTPGSPRCTRVDACRH